MNIEPSKCRAVQYKPRRMALMMKRRERELTGWGNARKCLCGEYRSLYVLGESEKRSVSHFLIHAARRVLCWDRGGSEIKLMTLTFNRRRAFAARALSYTTNQTRCRRIYLDLRCESVGRRCFCPVSRMFYTVDIIWKQCKTIVV